MKFRVNLCEKHYGSVLVDADHADAALEQAQGEIDKGNVHWTKTELVERSAVLEYPPAIHLCSGCGKSYPFEKAEPHEEAWYTVCPACSHKNSFTVAYDSAILQEMFSYCRVTRITQVDGYFCIGYHCDPQATANAPVDTTKSCDECCRAGCHIHTAAGDAEMLLNGEKSIEDLDDFRRNGQ